MKPTEDILEPRYLFFHFSIFLQAIFFISILISNERGKDRKVFTTSGTHPWSFVTQTFHRGQSNRGCDRKTFKMTNVHPSNRFVNKDRIWYDYLCPHEKEEMT